MRFRLVNVPAIVILSGLTGCAALPGACPAPSRAGLWTEVFFGRSMGDQSLVSEEAFQAFVDTEVTPRFPEGLTILDAQGQWRTRDGRLVREPSKILLIALPPGDKASQAVDEVREAYRKTFHQESVLRVTHPGCVAF